LTLQRRQLSWLLFAWEKQNLFWKGGFSQRSVRIY
jgi:hypothetical protein